jgi:hypothetical protein
MLVFVREQIQILLTLGVVMSNYTTELKGTDKEAYIKQHFNQNDDIDVVTLKDGSLSIATIIKGYLVTERYYYYSKKEAIKMFRNKHLKEIGL